MGYKLKYSGPEIDTLLDRVASETTNLPLDAGEGTNALKQKTIKTGSEDLNYAYGYESVAFNHETKTYQKACAAFGGGTEAGQPGEGAESTYGFCFAIGELSTARGRGSFASGNTTKALGQYSFSANYQTEALADWSVAFGNNTVAQYQGQFVCGYNNSNKSDTIFEVGIGTSSDSSHRQNGLEVWRDGTVKGQFFDCYKQKVLIYGTGSGKYTSLDQVMHPGRYSIRALQSFAGIPSQLSDVSAATLDVIGWSAADQHLYDGYCTQILYVAGQTPKAHKNNIWVRRTSQDTGNNWSNWICIDARTYNHAIHAVGSTDKINCYMSIINKDEDAINNVQKLTATIYNLGYTSLNRVLPCTGYLTDVHYILVGLCSDGTHINAVYYDASGPTLSMLAKTVTITAVGDTVKVL